jgi:hypothetical protein
MYPLQNDILTVLDRAENMFLNYDIKLYHAYDGIPTSLGTKIIFYNKNKG